MIVTAAVAIMTVLVIMATFAPVIRAGLSRPAVRQSRVSKSNALPKLISSALFSTIRFPGLTLPSRLRVPVCVKRKGSRRKRMVSQGLVNKL